MASLKLRKKERIALQFLRGKVDGPLYHLLDAAGNPGLLTPDLKRTLAEHAAGNYRIMMITADELLAVAADRELPRLDEKLYIEVFRPPPSTKTTARKR